MPTLSLFNGIMIKMNKEADAQHHRRIYMLSLQNMMPHLTLRQAKCLAPIRSFQVIKLP